jgi:hypothetical protein
LKSFHLWIFNDFFNFYIVLPFIRHCKFSIFFLVIRLKCGISKSGIMHLWKYIIKCNYLIHFLYIKMM